MTETATAKVILHYFRFDGQHPHAQLWVWDGHGRNTPQSQTVENHGADGYGALFELDPAQFRADDGQPVRIGFIPRLHQSWDFKDGGDRFWEPRLGREIWLIGSDPKIYFVQPDIRPRILSAWLDAPDTIELLLRPPLPEPDRIKPRISLVSGEHEPVEIGLISALGPRDYNTQHIELKVYTEQDPLRQSLLAQLEGYQSAPVMPRRILFDSAQYFSDVPLGAIYSRVETVFRAFAPTAQQLEAVLFDESRGNAGRRAVALREIGQGCWEARVEGDLAGKYYALAVHAQHSARAREIVDPYAQNTIGQNSRSRIADLRAADPPGFRPIRRPEFSGVPADAVIYEMHVRDFTIGADSGVKAKGTYRGFVERGAALPGATAVRTGIEHLVELGVTHVQLLPIADFDNDEAHPVYDWGYMPCQFQSPEGMYASGIRGDERIRELKELVQGLHAAGIRVILDVVYNHTAPCSTFERLVPGYYHRRRDDGSFWDGSGCGNEWRSEAPMGRRCILDACRFWVEEYGVDGFRFDLLGLIDLETMQQTRTMLDQLGPGLLLYGEPWVADVCGLDRVTDKYRLRGSGIGAFNDHFRNALKGDPNGANPGYVQNGSRRDGVIQGLKGAIDDWAAEPGDSINYADCHDNLTLWDKLAVSSADPEGEREKMQRLTCGILGVAQGAMFLHGGVELLRSKAGEHNSYNKGDEINALRWSPKKERRETFDYVAGIIALRRAHPVFRLGSAGEVRNRLHFHDWNLPAGEAIVFTLDGGGLAGEAWIKAAVLINPAESEKNFAIPFAETAAVFVFENRAGTAALQQVQHNIIVPGRSLAVLAVLAGD